MKEITESNHQLNQKNPCTHVSYFWSSTADKKKLVIQCNKRFSHYYSTLEVL